MDMRLPAFQVMLAGLPEDPATFVVSVEVTTGDQLRAELEAGQLGLPLEFTKAPTHHTALWLWAALSRMGYTDQKFKDFQGRMLMVARVDDDDDGPGVDPTVQDQPTGNG